MNTFFWIDHAKVYAEKKDDGETGLKLAAAALKYLHQSCGILASMYNMPACPVFHAAHWYVREFEVK